MNPQDSLTRDAIIADLYNAGNGGLAQLPGAIKANQNVGLAQNAEQNLAQNFNQAGGAQGPIASILSRLGATFTGGEPAQYGGQAQADAQAIAQATGLPLPQIESSIPQLKENQTAAQASLGNIQALIQALTSGSGNAPGIVGAVQR